MAVTRGIVIGIISLLLMLVVTACQIASASHSALTVDKQVSKTLAQSAASSQSATVVWGRVPYCNCLADSATDNVVHALENAHLTVDLKELSPRDGWLYFAVTYAPHSASKDQVVIAMKEGGAEVMEGPP